MTEKIVNLRDNVAAPISGLRSLVMQFLDWNARRQAKAELRAMPNHLLSDIGIRREFIDQYVDGIIPRRVANVVEMDRNAPAPRIDGECKAA